MLISYQRRAFLVFIMGALGSTASSARATSDSLWDVLAKTQAEAARSAALLAAQPAQAAALRRRALGPVPGYTLPVLVKDNAENDAIFSKTRPKRGGFLGSLGDIFDRLENATGSKIKASGHNNISMRLENVSGNSASYTSDQYYGRGSNGVYTDTNVNVDATFLKYFHYQTSINNSLFHNPNENHVKLDYKTKSTEFELGDINAGFSGNSLIDFNRYLSGIKLKDQWSRQFNTSVLYSQTKAETRTITISGNNSSGPYYVYAGQIVEGSDRVRVDNKELQRGTDYTLDLNTGELNFTKGNVVLSTQSIAVTFETQGYNQQKGTIYGIRSEYLPTAGTKFGLTYVTQQNHGSSGLQTVTQQFYGHVDPTQPYILDQGIDLTKPLTVTVSGVPLVKNIDYTVDSSITNQIILKQSVPQTQVVQVQYIPLFSTITPGNTSIMGLDGLLSLGKLGSLTVESALSGVNITGNNIQGQAIQIRADLNPMRSLHTNLVLRDISPSFSSIQSPGFNQNEKSIEFSSDYTPIKNIKLNLEWQKAKRPSYSAGTASTQFTPNYNGSDDYNQYNLGVSYTFTKNGTLSLTRSDIGTNYAIGGFSKTLNDSLALTYGWKALTLDAGISHYKSSSNQLYSTTGVATIQQSIDSQSATLSKRIGLNWKATRWLDLNGSYSDSTIGSASPGSYSHTDARDSKISATMSPNRKLRLLYSYDLSDTGDNGTASTTSTNTGNTLVGTTARGILVPPYFGLSRDVTAGGSTTGTTNYGTGYSYANQLGGGSNSGLGSYGNYSGYYGGNASNGYGYSSFGGRSATHRLQIDYHPRSAMTMGLSYDLSSSLGTYQYNSDRNGLGLNFSYQPSDRFSFNTNYNLLRVTYTNGQGATNTNLLTLNFQGHPFGGKLGASLGWQSTVTTSTVQFQSSTTGSTTSTNTNTNSNVSALVGRLDYPINVREVLFVELNNATSSGYLASADNNLKFGLQYSLTRTFGLSLGWQFLSHVNKDAANAQYNYKVSSLLAEIGFNFN